MTDQELDELEARLQEAAVERKTLARKMFKKELLLSETDEWRAADAIAELRKKNAGLVGALQAAAEHLDYCGYGDKWERECALAQNLPEKIEAALKENTQ